MGKLMKGIVAVGAISLAMLAAVACGKPGTEPTSKATTMAASLGAKASCDTRPAQRTCSEFPDRQSFGVEKSLCEAMHGKFALGACPSSDQVGLCSLSDGETKRYYAPKSREEAKADCESVGGAFR
jgi:hypothetical protein